MISQILSNWISESESWQTFIDFRIQYRPNEDLPFITRFDDFYISLFERLNDYVENNTGTENELIAVAKGLEIFSLKGKSDSFYGVNQAQNVLFAASLYFLAGYPSSAYILANLYKQNDYNSSIEKFLIGFLQRKPDDENNYTKLLISYLESGRIEDLDYLSYIISENREVAYVTGHHNYMLYVTALKLIQKFQNDNVWTDLLVHNEQKHWEPYISKSLRKKFPIWNFFPSQKLAIEKGILGDFKSISLQTPTSSGKTAICELIIYNEVQKDAAVKILYLAPFRALAVELRESFGRNLSRLGIRSRTIFGGDMPSASQKQLLQNVSLLIATPEKFIALENSIKDFLNDFSVIICDEGHLLDDGNRGLHYELLLSRLKGNDEVSRKFVFISALIPNIEQINFWLGGDAKTVVKSNYRSTALEYGFLRAMPDERGSYLLDVNPLKAPPQKYILNNFLTKDDFKYPADGKFKRYSSTTIKSKTIAVALKSLNLGSVAVFTPNKGGDSGVSGLADELIRQINIGLSFPKPNDFVSEPGILDDLTEYFSIIFGTGYALCRLVAYGALFHHGDLPQYVREVIEDTIRSNYIKFIICTNTLAEGVNLPLRTLVINSTSRFDPDAQNKRSFIELRDLKNLVGRAGRAGKETKGLVIITNPADFSHIESLVREDDSEIKEVTGFLFQVIQDLLKEIREKRLKVTNEMLEAQNEAFKELIDTIDVSLIDLLAEEVEVATLSETVQKLIDQTFAKYQANASQEEILRAIFDSRAERLQPFIVEKEFKFIKQSGTTLRLYIEIKDVVDFNSDVWSSLEDPMNETWLSFLIEENIALLPTMQFQLKKFNTINKTDLEFNQIKEIVRTWIGGAWFDDIAEYFNGNIEIALKFINGFVCYNLHSACSTVIRNAQLKLDNTEILPAHITNFAVYLLHGLNTNLHLNLLELGFNDRIAIIALADILEFVVSEDINVLNQYLIDNQEPVLAAVRMAVPNLVFEKISQSFLYLSPF